MKYGLVLLQAAIASAAVISHKFDVLEKQRLFDSLRGYNNLSPQGLSL
jgi:hypothetical protein